MVTTTTTWDRIGHENDQNIKTAKDAWVQQAIADGKTTRDFFQVNSLSASKQWTDTNAADEWIAFITQLATANGYTVTVTKV